MDGGKVEGERVVNKKVYRKLAERLDAFPIGFSATGSGVELRLLARIFTPEEAALAGVMDSTPELCDEIAARAGVDPKVARHTLEAMARKGLIGKREGEGQVTFGLWPFIGAVYEQQLPRMDAELAELFEQYYQETRGGSMVKDTPPVHRVIPVEEAVPIDIEIFPYEHASRLVEEARSWAVRDCICRVQQRLIGKGCDHPVEVCLLFAPVAGVFDDSEIDRPISREQALDILRQAEEAGLVHCAYNFREGLHHICNCCTCACMFLRGVAEFGHLTGVAHSDFRSAVDAGLCTGCGDCTERCQFGALSVPDEVCVVDRSRCVGCGLCTTACPTSALRLERLPEGERTPPPADRREWTAQRSLGRG
jgi:electron transport complex protein RnfB